MISHLEPLCKVCVLGRGNLSRESFPFQREDISLISFCVSLCVPHRERVKMLLLQEKPVTIGLLFCVVPSAFFFSPFPASEREK